MSKQENWIEDSANLDLAILFKEIRMRLCSGDEAGACWATINGIKANLLETDTAQLSAGIKGEYRVLVTFN